ncbi:MAG: glycogen synthase GlgA [Clostridiaceae bacterium]|jgi:starch synthase|nr:glycogen synthase GlgA [Clostridiaceae bacterium]HOA55515.1 glycogen synthase GlgA [Clostridiales bacterium]HPZ04996.1 glycogen synthase GlgA [Clostridiales bacterium]HQD31995.1 glycogen synthase GlgA [Clostridiales bacterium]
MKILFVSAEMSPFAKTGGLADVAGSLPKALAEMGHDVRAVMPRYGMIKGDFDYVTDFAVRIDQSIETCVIRKTEIPYMYKNKKKNLKIYFTDSYRFFDREGIYGHFDDAERFVFFCKAVLEMLPRINFKPDIIHCNDWHTGPICLLLKEKYRFNDFYKNMATLFTIHNLEYQGHFSSHVINLLNCDFDIFTSEKAEFYGMFNFMKTGLVYADIINTVSKVYAEEIKTPQYGERLEGLLQKRSEDLFGIVNGIDYDEFNPLTDSDIAKNYSIDNIADKKANKTALQKEMGLPCRDVPLISLISRLSGQKGLNLIIDRIDDMLSKDIQFVLLGTGDEYYHDQFRMIASRYPERIAVHLGFNPQLAQLIYAGSDMFLMPSRFEPCGLGQLISLRYGTIPIVRATGGLAETIIDFDSDNENGNGFSFAGFSSDEMLDAIDRAISVYNNRPDEWRTLIRRAMELDYSWDSSAKQYENLYKHTMKKRKSG